jgi:festuclavine dehydrogenase
MLSEILGRKITHTRLTEEEYMRVMVERGIPEDYARMLSSMDGSIAMGAEEQTFNRADVFGKRSLRSFFEANKDAWRTSD